MNPNTFVSPEKSAAQSHRNRELPQTRQKPEKVAKNCIKSKTMAASSSSGELRINGKKFIDLKKALGEKMAKASSRDIDAAAQTVFDELTDDIILGIAFDIHRYNFRRS